MVYEALDGDQFSSMKHFCKPGTLADITLEENAKLDVQAKRFSESEERYFGRESLKVRIEGYDAKGVLATTQSPSTELNAGQQIYIERAVISKYDR